ncbi:LLM class flavin-dependent oxidoreductase [Williamsia maris]
MLPRWARTVEELGFDALSVSDRPSWTTPEPLTSLAAAAAVTERIGLLTSVVVAPLHANAGLFATAVATIDRVAGAGRLRLGLAPGGRPRDYDGAPVDFAHRGRAFDTWLERVRAAWAGVDDLGPRPATPGGPALLFGGASTPTVRRITAHGSGWIAGGLTPAEVADFANRLTRSFETAGRTDRPHVAVTMMTSIGHHGSGSGLDAVRAYYADLGGDVRDKAVAATVTTMESLRDAVTGYESVGVDELIVTPNDPDPDTLLPLHSHLMVTV